MALTHEEVFQRWKASSPTERFRDYWERRWEEQINRYQELGWQLIPVIHHDKQPVRGANWKSEHFSYDVIRWHLTQACPNCHIQGGNIAVNAGDSGIIILDYDHKAIPSTISQVFNTMPVIDTPKGYAFVTTPPMDAALFDRLKLAYPDFDAPRGEGKYELVPLSETCAVPKHGTKDALCPPHDLRIRDWIGDGLKLPIPTFSDFAEIVLP